MRGAGDANIEVPPTIHALLEARLDKLGREERVAVEPASVIGVEFAQPAVESLSPEAIRPNLAQHLGALARKHFIDPAATRDKETIYRFHHHLVRDTVYNGLLKRTRATLHINFVKWADRINAERGRAMEFQEILGYHLEQAHRYLSELGPLDAQGAAVGADAAARLTEAGKRASRRGDMSAAVNLYRRAAILLSAEDAKRLDLLPELGEALMELGDFAQARSVLGEAIDLAERSGNHRTKIASQLVDMRVRRFSADEVGWSDEALLLATQAIPILESGAAHAELASAWRMIGLVHGVAARYGKASEASARFVAHARLAGAEHLVERSALGFAVNVLLGPTPVPEAIVECERILGSSLADRRVEGMVMCNLAQLRAMHGDFEPARALYRGGRALLRDLGQGVNAASTALSLACVELLAGDLATAESVLRDDCDFLVRRGETFFLSTMAAVLARVIRDQGRDSQAMEWLDTAHAAAAADDVDAQAAWHSTLAPILARRGDAIGALEHALAALALARQTDAPNFQGDCLVELARVQQLAGHIDAARLTIEEALSLYSEKGNRVSAQQVMAWVRTLA